MFRRKTGGLRHARIAGWLAASACLAAPLLVAACSDGDGGFSFPREVISGSGNVVEEQRAVSGFSGVLHLTEGNLFIEQGATESLLVRAEESLLSYIQSEVRGTLLELRTQNGVTLEPTRPIEFELTVVDVERVELAGVGDLEWLDLNRNEVAIDLSGVGDIEVAGQVREQNVVLAGVGEYDASELESTNATVELSGEGDVYVRVSGVLEVRISGTGSVYYYGSPTTIDEEITGRGSVEPGP